MNSLLELPIVVTNESMKIVGNARRKDIEDSDLRRVQGIGWGRRGESAHTVTQSGFDNAVWLRLHP